MMEENDLEYLRFSVLTQRFSDWGPPALLINSSLNSSPSLLRAGEQLFSGVQEMLGGRGEERGRGRTEAGKMRGRGGKRWGGA